MIPKSDLFQQFTFGLIFQTILARLKYFNIFHYIFFFSEEINSVSPTTGSTEGGTTLTISGVNFDETVAKAKVTVGGKRLITYNFVLAG